MGEYRVLEDEDDHAVIGMLNPVLNMDDNEFALSHPHPRKSTNPVVAPNMWLLENVGLYCQYAAAGLLYGSAGTLLPFCAYVYDGESNVCSNSSNLTFFAWNFKLLFAIVVDTVHPFGLRRKSWFLIGFFFVLSLLLVLAVACDKMSTSQWLGTCLIIQVFLMFATVPADGYSIELGELEPIEQKGQILVTGQRIFSLAVMELAKPGQEATTYELVVTVGNAASAISSILATQLLAPFRVVGCTSSDDDTMDNCGSNSVNLHSSASFEASNGPLKFTAYSCTLIAITITSTLVFVPFLPRNKAECYEWRRLGESKPWAPRPYLTLFLCVAVVLYGFVAAVLLLVPATSCSAAVGGEGC